MSELAELRARTGERVATSGWRYGRVRAVHMRMYNQHNQRTQIVTTMMTRTMSSSRVTREGDMLGPWDLACLRTADHRVSELGR